MNAVTAPADFVPPALTPIEYRGLRCITLAMIDEAHQRPAGTAGRNFRKNREQFVRGFVTTNFVVTNTEPPDYFELTADEIRRKCLFEISPKQRENIQLFTETGYLMIAKSLTDPLAWKVQRHLVSSYFSLKGELAKLAEKNATTERAYFSRFPERRTIRHMALDGEPYWYIGQCVQRSAATVGKAIAHMILWGLIEARRLEIARMGMAAFWAYRRKHRQQLSLGF
jgi:hypothetical protein